MPDDPNQLLREDRVKARVKGHFYTSGAQGNKRLGFDADANVDLQGR